MKLRDSEGGIWERQPDGSFRLPDGDDQGGYYEEPSRDTLALWFGPLTEVPE